jgi:hypothetical protein
VGSIEPLKKCWAGALHTPYVSPGLSLMLLLGRFNDKHFSLFDVKVICSCNCFQGVSRLHKWAYWKGRACENGWRGKRVI